MGLKITYHDTEAHADEAYGWDELIGKNLNDTKDVLGDFLIIHSEYDSFPIYVHIVEDEQGHLLKIWTKGDGIIIRCCVYNPIFTIEEG